MITGGNDVPGQYSPPVYHVHGPLERFTKNLQRRLKKGSGSENEYMDVLYPQKTEHAPFINSLQEELVANNLRLPDYLRSIMALAQ